MVMCDEDNWKNGKCCWLTEVVTVMVKIRGLHSKDEASGANGLMVRVMMKMV